MIKYTLLSIFVLFINVGLTSAEGIDTALYSLKTPYQTIYTHLNNLQENNFNPALAAQSFIQEGITQSEAQLAAIELKQVLDGTGIFIEMELIPNLPDFIDSTTNKSRYYLTGNYPSIYLVRIGDEWKYAKSSIKSIDALHKDVFPFGTDKLLNLLPKLGQSRFLGIYVWQLVSLLIIILTAFIVHKLFTVFFENLLINILNRFGYKQIAHGLIKPLAKPISYLAIFPILMLFVPVLQLPAAISKYIIIVLKASFPIFLTVLFYRLVDILGAYMMKFAEKTENTLDDQLVPLVRKVLKTFVVITGALFVLINLNISIIPFITGISIGGLAFALAAQDTIKNFFGSLMIFIDKPFQVGNWITSGDIDGEVEEVGLRSTRVRTFRDSLIYVPNGVLADRTIDNHGLRHYRRYFTKLNITYDTPPRVIRVFIEGLNRIVEEHPHTRKDKYHIFLNDFGGHSLEIMFYIFFKAKNWALELEYRHQIMLSILELAEKLHIRFAFPTRTLHMESFPEKQASTPEYLDDEEQSRLKMMTFFEKTTPKKK